MRESEKELATNIYQKLGSEMKKGPVYGIKENEKNIGTGKVFPSLNIFKESIVSDCSDTNRSQYLKTHPSRKLQRSWEVGKNCMP